MTGTDHIDGTDLDARFAPTREAAPPPLSSAVTGAVGEKPKAVSPVWPGWLRFALAAVVGGGNVALVVGLHGTSVSTLLERGMPGWWWLVTLAAWAASALVLTWLAVRESDPRVPESSTSRVVAVAAFALVFAGVAVCSELVVHGRLQAPGPGFLASGMHCLGFGSLVEIVPVGFIFVLLARGMPFRPVRAGLVAGAACGAWSLLVLQLDCPDLTAFHDIVFHLGVAVVWAVAGAGLGALLGRLKGG